MNKDFLSCDVVLDLLPSYIDGLCSPKTSAFIEAHLQSCPACAAACEAMRRDVPEGQSALIPEVGVDFLQKQNKKNRKLGVISAVVSVILVLVVLAFCFLYVVPHHIPCENLEINVTELEDGSLRIEEYLLGRFAGLSRMAPSSMYFTDYEHNYVEIALINEAENWSGYYQMDRNYYMGDLLFPANADELLRYYGEGENEPDRRKYSEYTIGGDGIEAIYYNNGGEMIVLWERDAA